MGSVRGTHSGVLGGLVRGNLVVRSELFRWCDPSVQTAYPVSEPVMIVGLRGLRVGSRGRVAALALSVSLVPLAYVYGFIPRTYPRGPYLPEVIPAVAHGAVGCVIAMVSLAEARRTLRELRGEVEGVG